MSMTTGQRLEWAHNNLDRYLRECDVQEFLAELADVSHLEDRVCNLENAVLDVENTLEDVDDTLNTIKARVSDLEEAEVAS